MCTDNQASGQIPMNLTAKHDPVAVPLREASRWTQESLAMLGHEMRNPISALSHALEVWEEAQADPVTMEELRHLMKRQVSQLLRFSEDLLDAERIAQGKLTLRQEPVDLQELIDDACEEIRPFIDQCGHALTVRMSAESIVVRGDRCRLLQVFANLIQNAAKFTGRQGRLCVTVEPLDNMAVVRVSDNGPGIEEHLLSNIFEPFTQLNGTCGPKNDGLGIGLRLVKMIVELHGGSVVARSAGRGHGSEFTVMLPLSNDVGRGQRRTTQPDAAVNGHAQRPPSYRIVVVDDERSNRELLAKLLRTIGQSVTVANDGEMAVRMVLDERPQVVFLDLIMPGIDGCEVARQLRGHPELTGLALVALSGSGDEHTKQQAMAAGFDKYLVKPIGFPVLVETLNFLPVANRMCQYELTDAE